MPYQYPNRYGQEGGGLRYVDANPANTALQSGLDSGLDQARREYDLQAQMRKADEQSRQDEAIRSGLTNITARPQQGAPQAAPAAPAPQGPPTLPGDQPGAPTAATPRPTPLPGPGAPQPVPQAPPQQAAGMASQPQRFGSMTPVVENLARTPGGGTRALELAQAGQAETNDNERRAMTALAAGDMTVFNHFAAKAGLQLPPQVLQNAERAGLFARGMLVAEHVYKGDPAAALRFAQIYVQNGGDPLAAAAQMGAPPQVQQRVAGAAQRVQRNVAAAQRATVTPSGAPLPPPAAPVPPGAPAAEPRALRQRQSRGSGRPTEYTLADDLASERAAEEGRDPTAADRVAALTEVRNSRRDPAARERLVTQRAQFYQRAERMKPADALARARADLGMSAPAAAAAGGTSTPSAAPPPAPAPARSGDDAWFPGGNYGAPPPPPPPPEALAAPQARPPGLYGSYDPATGTIRR